MEISKKIPDQQTITVLGSTGSVGCNTIDLIERTPEKFKVVALTANTNVNKLADQAKKFKPEIAVVADENCYEQLKDALAGTGIETAAGEQAVVDAASRSADIVMAGIVGAAGLKPTLKAVQQGTKIGLANKECLVAAGNLFMAEVKVNDATLIPIDSEHNAIYQIFDFDHPERIEKIILTASGGPFRTSTIEEMEKATPAQAIAHPVWSMGDKISIDSATMMNKGLELIEAYHLFPVDLEQIEVIFHPQSVIHSMVGYVDGSVLAQLGSPDMRTPIAFALAWPDRMTTPSPRLDLAAIATLTFEPPDLERFPALRLARECLRAGGCRPCVLNAANEIAVQHFLDGKIGFLDIARVVEEVLSECDVRSIDTLDDVHEIDRNARNKASALIKSKFMHI